MLIRCALVFLFLLPGPARAQDFADYKATTLDAVFDEWDRVTRSEKPGVTLPPPQKIKLVATLRSAPVPCSNGYLKVVLGMIKLADVLERIGVTHCFGVSSRRGRNVVVYVQDVLVPGLNSDAKLGRPVEIYALFVAYIVDADRSRNVPMLLVNRFEPQ